jgi:hypothetical protein
VLNEFGGQGVQPVPFFIQWSSDSLHPSQDSPKGCELQTLEIEHPNPGDLTTMLKNLGIEANVTQGKEPRVWAMLSTQKGTVRLS